MTRNVLAVGAHFDDVEMGCGGSLIRHVENGDSVTLVVVSKSGYRNHSGEVLRTDEIAYAEGCKAAGIMGVDLVCLDYDALRIPYDEDLTRTVMKVVEEREIDTIYSHWTKDVHRDHRHVGAVVLMAGRHVPRFLMYRSNFYDSDAPFIGTFYADISAQMTAKLNAIKAH
ncbi:MAG: PIG-L family deacetylase, partial [Rhodospirillales bacterium]|nr:PIG-L family deacetylase [Rhodospirillales bacterium]